MTSAKYARWVGFTLVCLSLAAGAEPSVRLDMQRRPEQTTLTVAPGTGGFSELVGVRLQRSRDLQTWENVGTKQLFAPGQSQPLVSTLDTTSPHAFYRVWAQAQPSLLAAEGEDTLGYASEYRDTLAAVRGLSLEQFAERYPGPTDYLPQMTWDPTTATYFPQFNSAPSQPVIWHGADSFTLPDYTLTTNELGFFRTNGFVVSERFATNSFSRVYHGIFMRDLPVFVTSDSILHAWHRSFDGMLAQIEDAYLFTELETLLDGVQTNLTVLRVECANGPLAQSVEDLDYYLWVARSLLAQTQMGGGQKVAETLGCIQAGAPQYLNLFGRMDKDPENPRNRIDFSLFKPRGHYTLSPRLSAYFQATVWCGLIDLRIAGNPEESSPRELGVALLLREQLIRGGVRERWSRIDQVIQRFVGPPDSMTFPQMDTFLESAGVQSLSSLKTMDDLVALQAKLTNTSFGLQLIQGHNFQAPLGGNQLQLPRSFTLLGQRFVPDSWVTSELVFNRLPLGGAFGARRMPSALDVAFTVFGNDAVAPLLLERMSNSTGVPFRDGYPYQPWLAGLRMAFDQLRPEAVTDNLYNGWLAALRALSAPTTDARYPEAMRTRAWAMKNLNTQLASWTQLRHDTLAYVKQSVTAEGMCSYPAGFVEPVPAFYRQMGALAGNAAASIGSLNMQGYVYPSPPQFEVTDLDLGKFQANMVTFLNRFAATAATLEGIANKELLAQPLSASEATFLKNVVEIERDYFGILRFNGWYPGLFYKSNEGNYLLWHVDPQAQSETAILHDSDQADLLVADVHTDTPDQITGDPGGVLHEGVGNVYVMTIAVDNGPDRMVYAGPVFSHFEFTKPYGQRWNDSEWAGAVNTGNRPPHPEWTREYLVPVGEP